MIIDCFTYYNEVDVLRIHLEELYHHVDAFVIVEGNRTFAGDLKPLYFDDLPSWIDKFKYKIYREVCKFPNSITNPWDREHYQRNHITHAIDDHFGLNENDIVIIGDVDEIVHPATLNIQDVPAFSWDSHQIDVTQYFWNLNWQVPQHCNQGARPVITKGYTLIDSDPQDLRAAPLPRVGGGWHFSFLGTNVKSKVEAFSHQEYNTERFKHELHTKYCIEHGLDPFERFPLKYTPIDKTYPTWVQKNQDQLQHLIIQSP